MIERTAFEIAIVELGNVQEGSYKDSVLVMQLLHDRLALWDVAFAEGDIYKDKGECKDVCMDQVVVIKAARAERKVTKAAMKATKKLKAVEKAVAGVEKVAVKRR